MRGLAYAVVVWVGVGLGVSLAPATAHACGGFFCSGAPPGPATFSSPVVQAGEQIVFAVAGDGTVEAHVQIQYAGTADSFGWIVPVPAEPELELGTDDFFTLLTQATAPRFTLTRRTTGRCGSRMRPMSDTAGCASSGDAARAGFGDAGASIALDGGSDAGPGVDVRSRESLGPFDAVVLRADDADALFTWLTDNEWTVDEASIPVLMEYVDAGDWFVALKLLPAAGVDQIQPIVMRFREEQPCVPIRLTAVSTVPDLPITVYVLGRARAIPWNYQQTEVDLGSAPFWTSNGRSPRYVDLVSMAADDAGGRAFVTEYAGTPPTPIVGGAPLPPIDDLAGEQEVAHLLRELRRRGYSRLPEVQALIEGLVEGTYSERRPPFCDPDAWDFDEYPRGDDCNPYVRLVRDETRIDATALIEAIDARVLAPRRRANGLLRRHPWITRMFTTMSGDEMTEDPVFVFAESMGVVSNQWNAQLVTECTPRHLRSMAPLKLVLPNGDEVVVFEGMATLPAEDSGCGLSRTGRAPGLWLVLLAAAVLTTRRRRR